MKKILIGSVFTISLGLAGVFFTTNSSNADCTLTENNPNAQCLFSETSGYFCGETTTTDNCKKSGGSNEVLAHA